jgi:PAS domain S-box-containing protein
MTKKSKIPTSKEEATSSTLQTTFILLVEDEPSHVEAILRVFQTSGSHVEIQVVDTLAKYRAAIKTRVPNIALMDIKLPDGRAIDVLTFPPDAGAFPIVIMTSYGKEEIAVEAMKAGALDYIVKSPEAFSEMPRTLGRTLREWDHILERKQSEEKYRALFNNAPAMLVTLDQATGNILDCNNLFLKRTGFEQPAVVGKNILEQFHPDCQEKVRSVFDDVSTSSEVQDLELDLLTVLGGKIPILLNVSVVCDLLGKILFSQLVMQDITTIKKSEEEIRESEKRLQAVTNSAIDSIMTIDETGLIIGWNPAAEKMFGYSESEIISHPMEFLMPERYLDGHQKGIMRIQSGGERHVIGKTVQMAGKRKDGSEFPLELSLAEWQTKEGRFFTGFIRDITDRKRTETALQESELRFRSLYENSTVGLYRTTPGGNIVLANPTLVKMLGYSSFEELATRNLDIEGFEPSYTRKQFIDQVERKGEVHGLESVWTRIDGSTVYIRESARAIRDSHGKTIFYDGSVEDITDRKKAEEELQKKISELQRFHNLTVGRELTMIELKKEINAILAKTGQPEKYRIVE